MPSSERASVSDIVRQWRSTSWQVGARLASIGLQGAAFALGARLLELEAFGSFAAAFALASLIGAASEFGLQNTTVVELSREPGATAVTLTHATVASVGLGVMGLVLASPIAVFAFDDLAAVAFACLVPWSVLSRLSTPGVAWWQARLEFRRIFLGEVAGRGLAVIGLVVMQLRTPTWSSQGLIISAGCILAIGAVVQLGVVLPLEPLRLGAKTGSLIAGAKDLFRIAAPLGVVSALSLIHVRADQVMLEMLGRGGRELASYAVAYRSIEGVAGVLGAVATVGFAVLSRSRGMERLRVSRLNSATAAMVGLAGTLLVLVTAPIFVAILGGSGFEDAVWPTRLLAVIVAMSVVNMVPALTIVAQSEARRLLPVAAVMVMMNLGLNLALIPTFGSTGAAASTILTEMIGLGVVSWIASRVLPGSQRVSYTLAGVGAAGVATIGYALPSDASTAVGLMLAAGTLIGMVGLLIRSRSWIPVEEPVA